MNKISKGKAVGLLSLGLASVALGSVGFASWVVSTTTVSAPNSVSATVGAIADQRITMTATVKEGAVAFDSKESAVGPITSTETKEDLIFSIDYTLTAGADLTNGAKATWTVALPTEVTTNKYAEVIGAFSDAGCQSSITEVTAAAGENAKGIIYFKLGWGEAFKYKNPSDLTEGDITESYTLDSVIASLKDLQDIMVTQAEKITVTFTATAKTA